MIAPVVDRGRWFVIAVTGVGNEYPVSIVVPQEILGLLEEIPRHIRGSPGHGRFVGVDGDSVEAEFGYFRYVSSGNVGVRRGRPLVQMLRAVMCGQLERFHGRGFKGRLSRREFVVRAAADAAGGERHLTGVSDVETGEFGVSALALTEIEHLEIEVVKDALVEGRLAGRGGRAFVGTGPQGLAALVQRLAAAVAAGLLALELAEALGVLELGAAALLRRTGGERRRRLGELEARRGVGKVEHQARFQAGHFSSVPVDVVHRAKAAIRMRTR